LTDAFLFVTFASIMSLLEQKNCGSIGLTFEDILLLPGYADFWREEVDISTNLSPSVKLNLPIISTPMDTVTTTKMAIAMAQNGGMGVIHRSISVEAQANMIREVKNAEVTPKSSVDKDGKLIVAGAVGVGSDLEDRIRALVEAGANILVLDTAHGHVKFIIDAIKLIKSIDSEVNIMAGNITTKEGALALIEAGVNILRVGMGPGSICTTRIVTGVGVPQLTAISMVKEGIIQSGKNVTLVADGGIKQLGDIAKAIAFGADAVMLGSLLAGYDQSPGEIQNIDGSLYKSYRGMGSAKAMSEGSANRYGQAGVETKKLVSEGVEGLVRYKGDVEDFLYQINGSLRSSCYYIGGKNLKEFQSKSKFIQITPSGLSESMPHSITVTEAGSSFIKK
jgi:IMP dehydrogenase